jgi:hypothetical protein
MCLVEVALCESIGSRLCCIRSRESEKEREAEREKRANFFIAGCVASGAEGARKRERQRERREQTSL